MFPRQWKLERLILLTAVVGLTVAPARAERNTGVELGFLAGLIFPDEDLVGNGAHDPEAIVGLWLGGDVTSRWGWFGDLQYASFRTDTFAGDTDMIAGRAVAEYRVTPPRKVQPFYTAGAGYTSMTFDNATDYFSAFLSVGVGQRIAVRGTMSLRWEARLDHSLAPDGLRGEDLTQIHGLVGLTWGIGRTRRDGDGDGIAGHRDRCPDTPAGATVDSRGCPLDGDRDGIADGIDRCADSSPGASVGADGCPPDGDRDGVPDLQDDCPATPSGLGVNRQGCPPDADGDGVPDTLDDCPRTLKGIEVDERGCFLDRDGDGVYDGLGQDKCPDTPPDIPVDEHGCPVS